MSRSSTECSPGSKEKKARVSRLKAVNFFPFQWQYEDENLDDEQQYTQTVIHVYGWNDRNESVHLRVEDFPIPMWIELPEHIDWTERYFNILESYLKSVMYRDTDKPKAMILKYMQPLYFANIVSDPQTPDKFKNKTYPYLQITFRNTKAMNSFAYKLKNPVTIPSIGEKLTLKCHCYEQSTTPVIKLLAFMQLPSANWILAKGEKMEYKETSKTHEYICSFKNLKAHPKPETMPIVYPKVLSFDNEAYSSNPGSMPKASITEDHVFMIGCTITRTENKQRLTEKYLLVVGPCAPVEGATVISFKSERQLYGGFAQFVQEHDPDVIIGYNIFGWDIKFMLERSENLLQCANDLRRMGCYKTKVCPVMNESWESSAYGKQDMTYIECDGRLFIDMLPYVQRNFKLSNYRLETVCNEFLTNQNKDPLKAKDIFELYDSKDPVNMSIIAKYCVQDSYVTMLLYDKLLTWFDLTETATTNGVPIFYIYTKGQQIKMYAQMLKYAVKNNIVIESNAYTVGEDEQYVGATVTEPRAGLYKTILPFDFASLYPSIIMAYNIDMSTLVDDRGGLNPNITDDQCHIIAWDEHWSCDHDTKKRPKGKDGKMRRICASYRYRFLKPEVIGKKGVIPTLLENLIKARKDTRKLIAKQEEEIEVLRKKGDPESLQRADELESMNLVLDKRQLSYKVSANSMYGAMGVKQGKLPFLPGAMCTTYIGRVSIKKASRFLEDECGGQVIYNDTDSAYTYFPALQGKSSEEIWQFAEDVVKRVAKLFPPPMKLEFEDKVYHKFLILTKKRYVAQPISRDGVIEEKLFKRGVVLQRRDNCPLLREIYQQVVWYVLNHIDSLTSISRESTRSEILHHPVVSRLLTMITDDISDALFEFKHSYKNFVITKALKRDTYKTKQPPAHVYVAQKMKERGIDVPQNSRVEYVLLDSGNGYQKQELQHLKAEDVNFYVDNKEHLRLDYLYYLEKQFVKPLNELLKVVVYQPKLMKEHLKDRISKSIMVNQLRMIFQPQIRMIEDIQLDWQSVSLYDYLYTYGGVPYQYRDFFYRTDVMDELQIVSVKLQEETREKIVYPSLHQVFRAFIQPSARPKVVILGQDPYHNGAACGLAFSVERTDEPLNPSLVNILKEVEACGFDVDPGKGRLDAWAQQGVMLLNTALTVVQGLPESHLYVWRPFTKLFLEYLKPSVGLLWGRKAIDYKEYFQQTVCTSHPSPLGFNKPCGNYPPFAGSKCFQKVNTILNAKGTRVRWDTLVKVMDLPAPSNPKEKK